MDYVRRFPLWILLVLSCGFVPPEDSTITPTESLELSASQNDHLFKEMLQKTSIDEVFEAIESRYNGFSGYHYLDDGTLVLKVSPDFNLENSDDILQLGKLIIEAPRSEFDRRPNVGEMYIETVKFSYKELNSGRSTVRRELNLEDIQFIDLDEQNNSITLGYTEEDTANRVKTWWNSKGLPEEMLRLERTEPSVFIADLTDEFRPVPGGVRFKTSANTCSVGFSARHLLSNQEGMLTAAHCTENIGQVDGDWAAQSGGAWFWLDKVGVEALDRPYGAIIGCPTGKLCRNSETAFINYDNINFSDRGYIARTSSSCSGTSGPCTTTIHPSLPSIRITSTNTTPLAANAIVSRVGHTSGWISGPVDAACVDEPVPGFPNRLLLCQNIVKAYADFGDSGGPVFIYNSTGSAAEGIVWGLRGTTYLYSPALRVFHDYDHIYLY